MDTVQAEQTEQMSVEQKRYLNRRFALIRAGLSTFELTNQVEGQPHSIVCCCCGRRSFHPNDIAQKYCVTCRQFHSDILLGGEVTVLRGGESKNMKSFYYWLLQQAERDDRVGDLARDAKLDMAFPKGWTNYDQMYTYLSGPAQASPAAMETLKIAWFEYAPDDDISNYDDEDSEDE